MKNKKTFTPKRIIIILALSIFILEGLLMFILVFFQGTPLWMEGLIDSTVLTLAVFPVLFYFVFRPMMKEIAQRTQAENELLIIKEELEERVNRRTKELKNINSNLENEISDRIKIELELRKLARAINNSPASVVITNTEGIIEYVNPKFTQVTGYTHDEAIGKNPRILKSGKQTQAFYKHLWDTISSGKDWRGEFCNRKKNGDFYWESASIAPVLDEKENVTHYVAVKEDITEQRAARKALEKTKDELEEYSRKIQDSNNMKDLLLDIITHDLKNPAGAINGLTGLLLEENSTDEMVKSINESSGILLKVIKNATALASVAMGESIEKEELNLNQMLLDVKSEFDQLAKSENVDIEFNPRGNLMMKANPILSEVFKNYLSNAIKYAKDGNRIVIEVEEKTETIKVSVNDYGKTIPAENREAIFLRQTRLDNPAVKGRGLGLAIVKRIAETHEAKVWIEPNEPTGNRFCFEIKK